ncbi:hypothetical protein K438DRAFT_2009567 [Mycena galopus ATCC 62051]|nr:hypothetical protein K438DRAFT_2009567 [Mycena galopus ATCC 62051]
MRLGELAWPDVVALRNWRKVILCNTVKFTQTSVGFFLPGHKADIFFEGNQIVIVARAEPELNTVTKVEQYLASRDIRFPHHPALFVCEDGSIPTRSWFLSRLHKYFDKDIAGHSLRAGGAMSLAEAGVAPEKIQAIGRWASDTFQIYMQKNPTLLQSMLFAGHSTHNGPRHIAGDLPKMDESKKPLWIHENNDEVRITVVLFKQACLNLLGFLSWICTLVVVEDVLSSEDAAFVRSLNLESRDKIGVLYLLKCDYHEANFPHLIEHGVPVHGVLTNNMKGDWRFLRLHQAVWLEVEEACQRCTTDKISLSDLPGYYEWADQWSRSV